MVNQIELHCFFQQRDITDYCAKNGKSQIPSDNVQAQILSSDVLRCTGIVVQAYSPLVRMQKSEDPTLVKVAKEVGKEPTQVLIRWSLQKG